MNKKFVLTQIKLIVFDITLILTHFILIFTTTVSPPRVPNGERIPCNFNDILCNETGRKLFMTDNSV